MKENENREKRPYFTSVGLGLAVLCFAAFLAVGVWAYYMTVGEFVTAELASLYAILSLTGAAAVLLKLWRFALPYYVGCALAWICGSYVGGLKGDFAPAAGGYTAAFLIAVFSLLGLLLQWRALRKKMARWKEERAKEKEGEKETAAEVTAAATQAQPEEGSAKDGPLP